MFIILILHTCIILFVYKALLSLAIHSVFFYKNVEAEFCLKFKNILKTLPG